VAWHWMWLLPTGYTFLLQAGSIGNDTFPTILRAGGDGLRPARLESRRLSDLSLSILAAALLTGTKATNLPLLLPWGLVVLLLLPRLLRRPAATLALVALAATISFLPHRGFEPALLRRLVGAEPGARGHGYAQPDRGHLGQRLAPAEELSPAVLPAGGVVESIGGGDPAARADRPDGREFRTGYLMLGELPMEDGAGIGFGISVCCWSRCWPAGGPGPRHKRTGPATGLFPAACAGFCWRPMGFAAGLLHEVRHRGRAPPHLGLLSAAPALAPNGRAAGRDRPAPLVAAMAWGALLLAVPVLVLTPGGHCGRPRRFWRSCWL